MTDAADSCSATSRNCFAAGSLVTTLSADEQTAIAAHRMPHTYWTYVRVGFITIVVGAAAEGLGARQQLHVGLYANNCLILGS